MKIRTRLMGLMAAGTSILGLTVAAPTVAHAEAQGCTPAGIGTSCVWVKGSGLVPGEVTASRIKTDDAICGYKAIITVNNNLGDQVYRWDSGILHGGGCSYGRAYVDHVINQSYGAGYQVCSRFYEQDVQQGGSACIELRP